MIVAVRTLFQRSKELGKQWLAQPGLRLGAQALGLAGGGFLASAASLRGTPQPLAMGLILRFGSWRSLCVSLGSLVGYRFFWGDAAEPALWWVLGAGILALLGLPEKVLPMLGLLVVGIAGVCLPWERSGPVLLLRLGVAGGSIWIFGRKDRLGRWLQCAAASLALAQAAPIPWLGLGYAAAGALAVGASFPAAALAGLGLDLAHITRLPMTAVVTLGWMGRLLPRGKRYRWSFPAGAALVAMVAMDLWDWRVLPGLALGGAMGLLLPAPTTGTVRAGATGPAQVRLELAAEALGQLSRAMENARLPPIDREALLQRVRSKACGGCPARKSCLEQSRLTVTALEDGHPFPCRKPGRLRPELVRSREQLRLLRSDHRRREEYRTALIRQYRSTQRLLRHLADRLPRRQEGSRARFGVTVAVRTRGKNGANGDRWAAFPGSPGKYYVLLCDGMGTGPEAGTQGSEAIRLLRQLLTAEFTATEALGSLNAMLTLSGRGGAVTVDLAELRLDTGTALLYKWGAAPSWQIQAGKAEKIGTATPPPGLSVGSGREWQGRLSLKGERMLILISDGVDGEEIPRRVAQAAGAPPGELAERLLEGEREDDATAAVIRLYPRHLARS